MRLRLERRGAVWAVTDRHGDVVWANESWLACVAFLRGYDTALQLDSGGA